MAIEPIVPATAPVLASLKYAPVPVAAKPAIVAVAPRATVKPAMRATVDLLMVWQSPRAMDERRVRHWLTTGHGRPVRRGGSLPRSTADLPRLHDIDWSCCESNGIEQFGRFHRVGMTSPVSERMICLCGPCLVMRVVLISRTRWPPVAPLVAPL